MVETRSGRITVAEPDCEAKTNSNNQPLVHEDSVDEDEKDDKTVDATEEKDNDDNNDDNTTETTDDGGVDEALPLLRRSPRMKEIVKKLKNTSPTKKKSHALVGSPKKTPKQSNLKKNFTTPTKRTPVKNNSPENESGVKSRKPRNSQSVRSKSTECQRLVRFTAGTLAPTGALGKRLDYSVMHWPKPAGTGVWCQMHYFLGKVHVKGDVAICEVCKVALCFFCYKVFHTRENLVEEKDYLLELSKEAWEESDKAALKWK